MAVRLSFANTSEALRRLPQLEHFLDCFRWIRERSKKGGIDRARARTQEHDAVLPGCLVEEKSWYENRQGPCLVCAAGTRARCHDCRRSHDFAPCRLITTLSAPRGPGKAETAMTGFSFLVPGLHFLGAGGWLTCGSNAGRRMLVALTDGFRESTESWTDLCVIAAAAA